MDTPAQSLQRLALVLVLVLVGAACTPLPRVTAPPPPHERPASFPLDLYAPGITGMRMPSGIERFGNRMVFNMGRLTNRDSSAIRIWRIEPVELSAGIVSTGRAGIARGPVSPGFYCGGFPIEGWPVEELTESVVIGPGETVTLLVEVATPDRALGGFRSTEVAYELPYGARRSVTFTSGAEIGEPLSPPVPCTSYRRTQAESYGLSVDEG